MEESDRGVRQRIMCRVERASPGTDWENSWRLARLPGLGPDNIYFLFKLMHEILTTQEPVASTQPMASPSCTVVGCTVDVTEDLPHALILCDANNGVGHRVFRCLQNFVPNLDVESALRLELNVREELEILLEDLFSSPGRSIFLSRQI